jgi:serine/threonine-protein kinase
VLADTCGGLHAAHELQGADGQPLDIVHRDVSPQNILLNPLGVAKLIDFGIAKARGRLGEETNAGLLKGKIHYMAPEQATGGRVDRRADIFSVGAILYHLLAGKPPFDGHNQLAILHRLTSKQPPIPLPSTVHPAVAAVVKKALSHSPDARYSTAAEMQAAIENAMLEAKLPCTTTEVAAFVREHMHERAAKRKESIDLAIAAATERQRVRDLLKPSADASQTDLSPINPQSAPKAPPPRISSPNILAGDASSPGVSAPGVSSPGVSSSGVSTVGTQSSATLKSANVESEIPISIPPPPIGKKTIALVAGALVLGIAGTAAVMYGRTSSPSPSANASAPAPPAPTPSPQPTSNALPPTTASAISIDDLPSARPAPIPSVKPKVAATTTAVAVPTSTASTKKKVRVNDGF